MAARERLARRPSAPEFAGELEDGAMALSSRHSDAAGHIEQVFDTLGSTSEAFANMVLSQICNVCQMKGDSEPKGLNAALAVVHAIKPTGELETMLGLQLFATHALSMELMGRAHRAQDNAVVQLNVNLATKLQRTFAGHLEALDRHRRGGQQRVTVEHVHVHAGGQAVVGAVTTGGEASITNGGQPHGQDLSR